MVAQLAGSLVEPTVETMATMMVATTARLMAEH
jgi:hypothetical protein